MYPSYTYTSLLNRGPAVIGAPQFAGLTGAKGDGVKVAVVDDGVDNEHAFLSPAGLSYPAGFPKGPGGGTTPKVIVARGFAGPGTGGGSIDREQSFHGTFVAGVIAGVEGTDVEASRPGFCNEDVGACHPAVADVSGVAPRAYIGNYRVFNVPLPLGGCCSGSTPEIVKAFEAAVQDGMDVINFSGGGPQADPRTDALIETVANVVRAGVVPIVSAGNDRDFFGLGTAGSPATAPDAIAVGATTNSHVFEASFSVVSPAGLGRIPFVPTDDVPQAWIQSNQRLVDVGAIPGANRLLCEGSLPAGSLQGAIALVSRGGCPYQAKVDRARAAGAIGMVVADSAAGDPGFSIFQGAGGTISDLDGARLRAAGAATAGAVTVRFTKDRLEVPTSWPGVPTSFSAGGLTPFGHALKPDVTAPGANILSSTLPEFGGDPFIVSAGTSFSAPHVAGAAALLLQRHPTWTPKQVKSALMSTAGRAFADTALTQEASVLLQGAGLVNVAAADRPVIFTDPQSLSFGYLDVNAGAASRAIPVLISDAGDGAGAWSVEVQPQVSSSGASVTAAPFSLSTGGTAVVQMVASAAAGAPQGDNFGFVVLRRGDVVRRVPYAFSVTRPQLTGSRTIPLKASQTGNTATGGEDRARVYRWPTLPFGILSIFGVDPSVNDDGKETVYTLDLARQAVNAGVVVERPALRLDAGITAQLSSNAPIHPWFLSSLDENDVQGYAGIPVNSNGLMPDFLRNVGAAGGVMLPAGRYYISVDSGRDFFTGQLACGPVPAALLGQRRQAAEHRADHEAHLVRSSHDRRPRPRRGVGRRSALDAAPLRPGLPAFGDGVRLRDRHCRLPDSTRGEPAQRRTGVHADLRVRLPGDEEHLDGGRQPDAELTLPGCSDGRGRPSDDHLGASQQGRLSSGSSAPAGRGRLECHHLVGRVLRRQAPDRADAAKRRRHLRDLVADGREEARGAQAHRRRLGHAGSRGRGRPDRPRLQVGAGRARPCLVSETGRRCLSGSS